MYVKCSVLHLLRAKPKEQAIRSLLRRKLNGLPSVSTAGPSVKSRFNLLRYPSNLPKRLRRRFVRYGLLAANLAVVGVAIFVVTNHSSGNQAVRNVLSTADENATSNPLDQLSATEVAVNVALMTRMPEAGLIILDADTVADELTTTVSTSEAVLKPQILSSLVKTKADIVHYTAADGETLQDLANKFGVTSDSIRWSNNLSGTRLKAGQALVIPPVNGIVVKVAAGDTADTLGKKYNVSKEAITQFNDAEITGLVQGEYIVVPGGTIKAAPRVTPYYAGFAFGNTAIYGYNGYVPGYCTWYVANKRIQIGRPLPANLGNAGPWARSAPRAGFRVDHIPEAGAAVVTDTSNPGHVAYVERVNDDGSVYITEMNRRRRYEVTDRTISAGEAGRYWYIH